MRYLARWLVALWLLSGGAALAGSHQVVVELYTSQGCSSCPPADKMMHDLAKRDDVIALALHVDYWDYIGWKDSFARPAFGKRQKAFAAANGHRSVYTPQMVIGGADTVVGARPKDLAELLRVHASKAPPVTLDVSRTGGRVTIRGEAVKPAKMVVHLVRYRPEASVAIKRGENAGRTLSYANIVTTWETIGEWDGRRDLSLSAPVEGREPVVVIVQGRGAGPIMGAARLR